MIHMVDARGQRVGEITVDEMELHLALTLDLGINISAVIFF